MNKSLAFNIHDTFFGNQKAAKLGASPGALISGLLPNILLIAGLILFVFIVNSGFHLLTDAGSTNQQSIAKHRSQITVAIIGFLIVVASYFILQFVLNTLGVGTIIN